MTTTDRHHPVRQLLDQVAATGQLPDRADIDALAVRRGVSPHQARQFGDWITEQAEQIAYLKTIGNNGPARRHAADTAAHAGDVLDPDPPDRHPARYDHLDAGQLADLVRGGRPDPEPGPSTTTGTGRRP